MSGNAAPCSLPHHHSNQLFFARRHYDAPPPTHPSEASHCLLGGVLPAYSSAVALQGLCTASASSSTASAGWEAELRRDLRHAVAWSGAPYAVGLVADVDSHSVKEVRIEEDFGPEDEAMENAAGPARCVMSMLESAQVRQGCVLVGSRQAKTRRIFNCFS